MEFTVLVAAVVASGSLAVGSFLGVVRPPSKPVLAAVLAFASGAFITALATDLFVASVDSAGIVVAGGSLVVGAGVFVLADLFVSRGGDESGFPLLVSALLDGIPESVALGVTFVGGAGTLPLLAAIVANNVPEAVGGSAELRESGHSKRFVVGLWTATALLLVVAVVAGRVLFQDAGPVLLAGVRSFAGGAVLATLADTTMPEAFEDGGPVVALATTAGFLATFVLTLV